MKTSVRSHPSLPIRDVADDGHCCTTGEPVAPSIEQQQSQRLAERLKILADPTRVRMLDLLAQRQTSLCVCELNAFFEQNQPTISHHLRILRQAGLIEGEKRGTWSYYAATEAGRRHIMVLKSLL